METYPLPCLVLLPAALCAQLCTLPQHHRQGIASVAFSRDGRKLATVGVDTDKSIAVWRSCSGEWYDAELQVIRSQWNYQARFRQELSSIVVLMCFSH